MIVLSSPKHNMLKVSFCDRPLSFSVCRQKFLYTASPPRY